jgi:hypothetical protein
MNCYLKHYFLFLILLSSLLYQAANILLYPNSFYGDAVNELSASREFLQTKTHVLLNGKFYYTTILNAQIYPDGHTKCSICGQVKIPHLTEQNQ